MVREITRTETEKLAAQWRASWASLPFDVRCAVRAVLLADEDVADAVLKE